MIPFLLIFVNIGFKVAHLLAVCEYIYSRIKGDGIYLYRESLGNLAHSALHILLNYKVKALQFALLVVLYHYLNFSNNPPTVFSFLTCFIIVDFLYYIYHWLAHTVNFFWTFHFSHHSGKTYNLTTSLRDSIIQGYFFFIFLIPALLIGFHPLVIATAYTLNSLYQYICHSQYLKFPRWLDLIFITSRTHSIHHDEDIDHQHSNYGGTLNIWDRLFGTYVKEIDTFVPGIKGYNQDNFIKMETDPIVEYLDGFKKTKKLKYT